ncbi:hypothetical protein ACOMHN_018656 [Nucella lapillus]
MSASRIKRQLGRATTTLAHDHYDPTMPNAPYPSPVVLSSISSISIPFSTSDDAADFEETSKPFYFFVRSAEGSRFGDGAFTKNLSGSSMESVPKRGSREMKEDGWEETLSDQISIPRQPPCTPTGSEDRPEAKSMALLKELTLSPPQPDCASGQEPNSRPVRVRPKPPKRSALIKAGMK